VECHLILRNSIESHVKTTLSSIVSEDSSISRPGPNSRYIKFNPGLNSEALDLPISGPRASNHFSISVKVESLEVDVDWVCVDEIKGKRVQVVPIRAKVREVLLIVEPIRGSEIVIANNGISYLMKAFWKIQNPAHSTERLTFI